LTTFPITAEAIVGNLFSKWIRVTWGIIAICLLAFLAMFILPRMGIDWRVDHFYLFFSIPVSAFCGFLLLLLYYYQHTYAKGAQELLAGKYLVHWKYDKEEWTRFIANEWKRNKRRAIWVPLSSVAGVVVLGSILYGLTEYEFKQFMPWILGLAAFSVALIYGVGLNNYNKSRKKIGELYVGETSLYFNEMYFMWDTFSTSLGGVRVLAGNPKILEFEILQISKTGYRSFEIRVPIPHAHEKDAVDLIKKLTS
jgi:hypothetical protein